jgi:glyoxylase-like metal-dependent hydrolase (beta-lactamase superfamily II)
LAEGGAVALAPGVYMVPGAAAGEPSAANRGRVGNAGFIVGPEGVVAIDSGTSYRQGVALLDLIGRTTAQPVRALIITHARQEFLFGAAAFRERGIPIHMQLRASRLMAARCPRCLKNLKELLGEDEMQGSAVVRPDHEFEASHTLALIDRPLRVLYFGHSSGPGDVAVLDERSGVLFAGGLLDQGHIPDVQDSDLPGWRRALAELRTLPLTHIVPGHGAAAGAPLVATVERYLAQLQAGADTLLEAGTSRREVPDALQLPEFKGWLQYDTTHRRNASVVFLRQEQALLAR